MMQYFYSDPVAAVWMAKQFGMKFSYSKNDGKSNGGGSFPDIRKGVLYPSPFCNTSGLSTCKTSRGGELIGSDRLFAFGDLYIHPDSLHLLEPQVGDVIIEGMLDELFYVCGEPNIPFAFHISRMAAPECIYSTRAIECKKIIQRDGKPFFWPECEEA